MKYKVGDKVRIKSLDWYYSNSDCIGDIQCGDWYFTLSQASYCGKVLTISAVYDDFYMMKGIGHYWTDEMIECLVDESQEKMISLDKACEWIEKNFRSDGYFSLYYVGGGIYTPKKIAKDFRKAMEE